jgi:hypothetical protein
MLCLGRTFLGNPYFALFFLMPFELSLPILDVVLSAVLWAKTSPGGLSREERKDLPINGQANNNNAAPAGGGLPIILC